VFCAYWRKTKLGAAGRSSIKNVNFLIEDSITAAIDVKNIVYNPRKNGCKRYFYK